MADIRVLVADDEPLARRGVCQLIARHAGFSVAGEARDGPETLKALQTLKPDLLFLDIQMPEMDGFAVLRAHGIEHMPAVVFVTAHDQYAIRAFEAHALDYLVKPLNTGRFDAAIARVREQLRLVSAAEYGRKLSALLAAERFVVSGPGGDLIVPASDIDWISADDYYARLHCGPRAYLFRESLNSLEKRLDSRFLRVHRAAIVQLSRVREVLAGALVLRDGTLVPVSRRRRAALERLLRTGNGFEPHTPPALPESRLQPDSGYGKSCNRPHK